MEEVRRGGDLARTPSLSPSRDVRLSSELDDPRLRLLGASCVSATRQNRPTLRYLHCSSATLSQVLRNKGHADIVAYKGVFIYFSQLSFIKHTPAIATESFLLTYSSLFHSQNVSAPSGHHQVNHNTLYLVTHLQKTIATSTDPLFLILQMVSVHFY
jgi:hypothetical protein